MISPMQPIVRFLYPTKSSFLLSPCMTHIPFLIYTIEPIFRTRAFATHIRIRLQNTKSPESNGRSVPRVGGCSFAVAVHVTRLARLRVHIDNMYGLRRTSTGVESPTRASSLSSFALLGMTGLSMHAPAHDSPVYCGRENSTVRLRSDCP